MDYSTLGIELANTPLIAGLVLGLTQGFKQVGVPTNQLPLIAGVIGSTAAVLLGSFTPVIAISGLVLGLTVSGVVNLVKGK